MNKRQEIALWIIGLILAAVCAGNGSEDGDWFFAQAIPLVIIGALVLYRLRSPSTKQPGVTATVAALAVCLGLAGIRAGHEADQHAGSVSWDLEMLDYRVGDAEELGTNLDDRIEDIESKQDDLEYMIHDLRSDITYLVP